MRGLLSSVAGLLLYGLFAAASAAKQPMLPPLTKSLPLASGPIEVEAGQSWSAQAVCPQAGAEETPILALDAYVLGSGGCNHVLQVLVDDAPLTESPLRRRLLNKLPAFDPPGTQYHFRWHQPERQQWMTIFAPREPVRWAGTGRDAQYWFDLTGLATPGKALRIRFLHCMPELPRVSKRDRAPLIMPQIALGVIARKEAERLRAAVEGADSARPGLVRSELPPGAKPGPQPYELEWSKRPEAPRAQVSFENLRGWTVTAVGDLETALEASVEKRLWRKQLGALSYSGGTASATIIVRPPQPIAIDGPFDAADLWLFAETQRASEPQPRVTAHLIDHAGRDAAVDLGPVTNSYWTLLHGVLPKPSIRPGAFPMQFVGLSIAVRGIKARRRLLFESLAFYQRNRKPYIENPRPARPSFPISERGMLPTPPADARVAVTTAGSCTVLTCTTAAGALRYQIDPAQGVLHGVQAQWNDGPWLRPMSHGELALAPESVPAETKPELLSTQREGDALVARWRQGAECEARYRLDGRTLVIDVACAGGAATGLRLGRFAGLPNGRAVAVPYLTYGTGYGPILAVGGGLAASTLIDWHHSDCSAVDSNPGESKYDGLGLLGGTLYRPLTDGRRNDLHDRVLVTVSPDLAGALPNIPFPPSPLKAELAPYMVDMASSFLPQYWTALKRYGVDHVITCDFARFYVDDFAEGFVARWRPHPQLMLPQIQDYRRTIKGLGYKFGVYGEVRDWFPLNEFWDPNCVALDPNGDLVDGWYGNFRTKPNYLPALTRHVGEQVHKHYPPDAVYMDTHSCVGATACDFEAGVPGAGKARDQAYFNGQCMLETRKWYGAVISEGAARAMYPGLVDIDYASVFQRRSAHETPLLVDFDLLKIHPLNLGTMMGYAPSVFFREGRGAALLNADLRSGPPPQEFYQYVSASLAYGHMLMIGYGYQPPLARTIQLYALMQGVQREYLLDTASEIRYHDGQAFLPAVEALAADSLQLGRLRVRYARGLTVYVNYNAKENWRVEGYELPPYGWLIVRNPDVLAYSALIDGARVDYVRCPEYIYLHAPTKAASVEALTVQGSVWLKREGPAWRLIPCGDLGRWEPCAVPGLPARLRDYRQGRFPDNRGCAALAVDVQRLLHKAPTAVTVTARNLSGQPVTASARLDDRLHITPTAETVDYLLR